MKALCVADWDRNFENSRSRQVERCSYLIMPNRHDGEAYKEMMHNHENGYELLGCWTAILQVASRCSTRGVLVRDNGTPHTPESIAMRTLGNAESMKRAITCFLQNGWLVEVELTKCRPGDVRGGTWTSPSAHKKKKDHHSRGAPRDRRAALDECNDAHPLSPPMSLSELIESNPEAAEVVKRELARMRARLANDREPPGP